MRIFDHIAPPPQKEAATTKSDHEPCSSAARTICSISVYSISLTLQIWSGNRSIAQLVECGDLEKSLVIGLNILDDC